MSKNTISIPLSKLNGYMLNKDQCKNTKYFFTASLFRGGSMSSNVSLYLTMRTLFRENNTNIKQKRNIYKHIIPKN